LSTFPCPYLNGDVELTAERERHITETHPDLLPTHYPKIGETLKDPDQVRRSGRYGNARMFSRWYDGRRGGKYVVVVTVSDAGPAGRHWIITAYFARRLTSGVTEWLRPQIPQS
jgi:hypothetical protein